MSQSNFNESALGAANMNPGSGSGSSANNMGSSSNNCSTGNSSGTSSSNIGVSQTSPPVHAEACGCTDPAHEMQWQQQIQHTSSLAPPTVVSANPQEMLNMLSQQQQHLNQQIEQTRRLILQQGEGIPTHHSYHTNQQGGQGGSSSSSSSMNPTASMGQPQPQQNPYGSNLGQDTGWATQTNMGTGMGMGTNNYGQHQATLHMQDPMHYQPQQHPYVPSTTMQHWQQDQQQAHAQQLHIHPHEIMSSRRKRNISELWFKHDRVYVKSKDLNNCSDHQIFAMSDLHHLEHYYEINTPLVVIIDIDEMNKSSPVHNTKHVFKQVFDVINDFGCGISHLTTTADNKLSFTCAPTMIRG